MKVLELFSGTQSIGKRFRDKGHQVLSIELNPVFESEPWNLDQWTTDILDVTIDEIIKRLGGKPDVIWASPTCTTHSIAAISKHRHRLESGVLIAKSQMAHKHDIILQKALDIINELQPDFYFIENPRGGMRKSELMQDFNDIGRYTVTYCQYGDTRMKPTDIWTNHPNPQFKPMCKNGDSCHESAPRGSKTGTQGLKGNLERSIIPKELCEHIVDICEEALNENNK